MIFKYKISFITTIFNEETSIVPFLDSLLNQSIKPHEIIIVDGGSNDNTRTRIKNYELIIKKKKVDFALLIKKGNRSVGRNEAIKHASGEIILCSDAGCILDKDWVRNIIEPFTIPVTADKSKSHVNLLSAKMQSFTESIKKSKNVSVVSGFYHPITNNVFEKCLAAYTCVMPDNINPHNFLPSSRSVAFLKSAWESVGGYPENLDTCEDLVFDRKLQDAGFYFYFCKDAIVYWPQRHSLIEAFFQFYSYAKGDGEALYIRPQTPLLFLRYVLGLILLVVFIISKSYLLLITIFFMLVLYILWAIKKNYRYVKKLPALYILPTLQFISDIAVLLGFSRGIIKREKLGRF